MKTRVTALFFFLLSAAGALAQAATFSQPYHDGAVIMLWNAGYSPAQIDALLAQAVQGGVKSVEVPVLGCQTSKTSADVGACQMGSRDQSLEIVRRAVAAGLGVSVLPIVETPNWDWRGDFVPKDVAGWFQSYTTWVKALAQDSLAAGATEFIVGSEFKALYVHTAQWSQVVQAVRGVFPGPLILTANWDKLDYDFWPDSDAIGISEYFPLASSRGGSPSQADLNQAAAKRKTQLLALSQKWQRPLYFTEVGFNNTDSAAVQPWSSANGPVNLNLQAQCFTAMQSAWVSEKALIRTNIWAISDPASDASGQPGFAFLNTPSEGILSAFFATRAMLGTN